MLAVAPSPGPAASLTNDTCAGLDTPNIQWLIIDLNLSNATLVSSAYTQQLAQVSIGLPPLYPCGCLGFAGLLIL